MRRLLPIALALLASIVPVQAIKIDLRYDFDTSGFFDQPGARQAMRAAANIFETLLTDSLDEIDTRATGSSGNTWSARPQNPETGEQLDLVDLVVPEDTVIIFLGSRDLPGSTAAVASTGLFVRGTPDFRDTVFTRGQPGASGESPTDTSPWGGSIAFDTRLRSNGSNINRVWNFSTTTANISGTNGQFISIALHELCHIFGIGIAKSWKNLADGNRRFMGPASIAANGGTAPILQSSLGHWDANAPGPFISNSFGSFGAPHGVNQQVLMNPVIRNKSGNLFAVLTDLEIAALIDIGWEVSVPAQQSLIENLSNETIVLAIPSTTNFRYTVERGDLISPFAPLKANVQGTGKIIRVTDTSPPSGSSFYRTIVSAAFSTTAPISALRTGSDVQTASFSAVLDGCCDH